MILSEFLSICLYVLSLIIFKSQFDTAFLRSWAFIWRFTFLTLISSVPLVILKFIRIKFKPPIQQKLMQYATLK
jgi:phospholipid-translocating ATPase